MRPFIPYTEALQLITRLADRYNLYRVDIGALEPLLYRDGKRDIVDLIMGIESMGLKVRMTTNGSLLTRYISRLVQTDIEKIRVSLHGMERNYFNTLTSSTHFDEVHHAVIAAHEAGLPIELNCLVLRGFERHAIDVVRFSERNAIPLKLHSLYFDPAYAKAYADHAVESDQIVALLQEQLHVVDIKQAQGAMQRDRTRLSLNHTVVEVKRDESIPRDNSYCAACQYRSVCGERFCEYIRIDPDLTFYPCYLRKDLRFDMRHEEVLDYLPTLAGGGLPKIRLVVSAICNFRCVFPGASDTLWCLKRGGNYRWPNRSTTPP